MMMDGFTSTLLSRDGSSPCVNYLFPTWTLDTPGKFAAACIGTILMGILIGLITKIRFRVSKMPAAKYQPRLLKNTLTVVLFAVNLIFGYIAMLIAMTYSVELFLSMALGLTMGYAMFNLDMPPPESTDPCCAVNEAVEVEGGNGADFSVGGAGGESNKMSLASTLRQQQQRRAHDNGFDDDGESGSIRGSGKGSGSLNILHSATGFTRRTGYHVLPDGSGGTSTSFSTSPNPTITKAAAPSCCESSGTSH
jgi:hypothetical protein